MTEQDVYVSPFAWRYGSADMRRLWSEGHRRVLMRRVWLALAEAQHGAGIVTAAQLDDLRRTAGDIDVSRAEEIERRTRHDVMAEVLAWAQKAPVGGGVIHLGATSADITDNVDALRARSGLVMLRARLAEVIGTLADRVDELADVVTLGWTHLQPAAPTTVGYRLAVSLEDFGRDLELLDWTMPRIKGKGFKGAVGTRASYGSLTGGTGANIEAAALEALGLPAVDVAAQVAPRKLDWWTLNALAGIAGSASTFAFNLRLLQSPPFGEWSEGFAPGQVGSSAMPWKRNPVTAENVNSLARLVSALPGIAWRNAAASLLERTLDDSANRRVVLPQAFLAVDEILARVRSLASGLEVDRRAVAGNVTRYGPFAAAEAVLIAAARAGGDRQGIHDIIRRHSLAAWEAMAAGAACDLADRLAADTDLTHWMPAQEVRRLVGDPAGYVGDAPARARAAAARARAAIAAA